VTFRATAVLPYDSLERATAGLRGRLRLMVADHGPDLLPDWDTLVVTGPTTTKDARGNTWFEWTGTVQAKTESTDATIVS
jgi:hypothetical protein